MSVFKKWRLKMAEKLPAWFTSFIQREQQAELPDWFVNQIRGEQTVEEADPELVARHAAKAEGGIEAALMNQVKKSEAPRFGYDSWFGRGTNRGPADPPKLPTQMRVKDIVIWQNANNPPGGDTAAIGAFQIVDQPNARTLSGLVKSMNLTGDELFTPELQDRMALKLMEGRGLSKFKAGKIDKQTFSREMAKEWASLPVLEDTRGHSRTITRGMSYYTGDEINKAQVGPSDMKAYEDIYASADIQLIGE